LVIIYTYYQLSHLNRRYRCGHSNSWWRISWYILCLPPSIRSQNTGEKELILVVGSNYTTGQSENTEKHYEELINFAKDIFTVEDIPYRWSTQDYITPDSIPSKER
jgi:hypothetical protein